MKVKFINPAEIEKYAFQYVRNIEDLNGNGSDIRIEAGLIINTQLNYALLYKGMRTGCLELFFNTHIKKVQNVCYLLFNEKEIRVLDSSFCFKGCGLCIDIPSKAPDLTDYKKNVEVKALEVFICNGENLLILIDGYKPEDLRCYYFDENNGILFHGNEVAGIYMKNLTDEEKQELLRYRTYDEETHSWRDLREKVGPPVKLMTPYVKK